MLSLRNFYSTQSAFRKQASHFCHPYPKHSQRNQGSALASASTCQAAPVNIQSANAIALLSGVAINNYSLISSSGNSGNFTVTNSGSVSSFTVYVSGITILNSNGSLNYLYNTGTFTRAQVGTVYASAISYSVVGGTVNTLVDTTSSPLVVSCTIAPTIQGSLYADQSAGTNPNLPTEALPTQSTTITTDQGYVLRIVPTSSTVRVTISRS